MDSKETKAEAAPDELVRRIEELTKASGAWEKEKRELSLKALFFAHNPAPVLRVCKNGKIESHNHAAAAMFGHDDLARVNLSELIPALTYEQLDDIIRNERVTLFSTDVKGRQIQFTVRGLPDYGSAHIYGSDVTEQRDAHGHVQKTLAELDVVVNTSAVGIARTRNWRFEWVNTRLEEIFGYEPGEMIGKSTDIVFPEGEASQNYAIYDPDKILGKGGIFQTEIHFVRKDGSRFLGRVQVKAIDPKNQSSGSINIFEDFSERKMMEDALREAKEQAEDATKLKDKFVSLVTHDLRSPVSTIISFLKLLQNSYTSDIEGQKIIIERALLSAESSMGMIENLLDINRLQTGKLTPVSKVFFANNLATEIIAGFSHLAELKEISLKNSVPEGLRLFGDRILYGEVLRNLLSNAIKFSTSGGRVTLFVPKTKPTAIAVSDEGSGIDANDLPHIFRSDVKTSRVGAAGEKGFGFGLPLSMEIMKAHGGVLTAESVKGKGATFTAELPERKPLALIVACDDESLNQMISSLEDLGCETVIAHNTKKGKEIFDQMAPHIVLIDVCGNEAGNFSMLEKIKTAPMELGPPVIMITASDCEEARERAFSLGADDVVGKPINLHDFAPRVKRFIEKSATV